MLSNSMRMLLILLIAGCLISFYEAENDAPRYALFSRLDVSDPWHFGPFHSPNRMILGMAAGPAGGVTFTDARQYQVVTLDGRGREVGAFGQFGQGPGDLDFPEGIDRLSDGSYLILDKGNDRFERFSVNGKDARILPIGTTGLKGVAAFPDGALFTGRDGPAYGSEPYFAVVGFSPEGKLIANWELPDPVVDVRREIHGRLWVLCTTGLLLCTRQGKVVKRLAVPPTTQPTYNSAGPAGSMVVHPLHSEIRAFVPKAMCQATDGRVYVACWDYVLAYDNHYRPLGLIPPDRLTRQPLTSITADANHHLWAADDHGNLVRLTLSS